MCHVVGLPRYKGPFGFGNFSPLHFPSISASELSAYKSGLVEVGALDQKHDGTTRTLK